MGTRPSDTPLGGQKMMRKTIPDTQRVWRIGFSDIHLKVRCLAGCRIRQPFFAVREHHFHRSVQNRKADAGLLEIRLDPQKSDETGADAEEQPAEETAM